MSGPGVSDLGGCLVLGGGVSAPGVGCGLGGVWSRGRGVSA